VEYASFFLPHVKTFTICLNNLCKVIKRFIIVIYVIAAAGPGKCLINHGGCWHETRNGKTFSACQVGLGFYYMIYGFITEYLSVASQLFFSFQESGDGKCLCPAGFRGDGVKKCEGAVFSNIICLIITISSQTHRRAVSGVLLY
jgi:hypothetical protein